MEHESDGDTNCNFYSWYSHQRIGTSIEGLGNKRASGDHPNYGIIEISQNTEKSPGDLRRLVANQSPDRNHRLMLAWKTLKDVNNNNYYYYDDDDDDDGRKNKKCQYSYCKIQ